MINELEAIETPFGRFVTHTMLEGLAYDQFILLKNGFIGDILSEIYQFVRTDEARHVALGVEYITTVLKGVDTEERKQQLERYSQFALEVSGFNESEVPMWLANLVGKNPAEISSWLLHRHQRRILNFFS